MSDFINIIHQESADNTAEIKGAKINGTNYKFDFNELKHKPGYVKLTEKEVILAETSVNITSSNLEM